MGTFLKDCPASSWETAPWHLHLNAQDPLTRSATRTIVCFMHIEDFYELHKNRLPSEPTDSAEQIWRMLGNEVHRIAAYTEGEVWLGDPSRPRSLFGYEKKKARDASRAKARPRGGMYKDYYQEKFSSKGTAPAGAGAKGDGSDNNFKGKGAGKKCGPSSAAASSGTPPAGGGASGKGGKDKPQRPFPPPWHDSDDSSQVGEQLSCMMDESFDGHTIRLIDPPARQNVSRWSDEEVDWD